MRFAVYAERRIRAISPFFDTRILSYGKEGISRKFFKGDKNQLTASKVLMYNKITMGIMKTTYYLNQDILPTIPTPHDCIVNVVEYNSEFLTLKFEDNISYHDSIKTINPNAKSLIIRIHLFDSTFDTYKWKSKLSFMKGEGFILENNDKLLKKRFKPMQYLAHYVACNSIIIELFQSEYIILKMEADFIEFEWIEK